MSNEAGDAEAVSEMPFDQVIAWAQTGTGEISEEQAKDIINKRRAEKGLQALE